MKRAILWLGAAILPLIATAQDFEPFQAALERADYVAAEKLLLPLLRAKAPDDPARAGLYWRLGALYVQAWRWGEAERELLMGLKIARAPGKEREDLLLELANLLDLQTRKWDLLQVLPQLLAVREARHGPKDPSVASVYTWIGELNSENPRRFSEAGRAFRRAEAILGPLLAQRPLSDDNYERVISLWTAGGIHIDPGPHELCTLRSDRVAQIEKANGEASRALIRPLLEYATFCHEGLPIGGAEAMLVRARGIAARDFGEVHPDVVRVDEALEQYYESGQPHQESSERRAAEIRRRIARTTEALYGKDSLESLNDRLGRRLEYISDCRFSNGDCQRVLDRFVESYGRKLGPQHPYTAMKMRQIARRLTESSSRKSESGRKYGASFHQRTLKLFEQIYTPDNPEWALQNHYYANFVLYGPQDYGPAAEILAQSLPVYRKHYGPNDDATLALARVRISWLRLAKRESEAMAATREAIDLLDEKNLSGNPFEIAGLLEEAAQLELQAGARGAAEQYWLRSLNVHRQRGIASHEAVVANKLAQLYRSQGQADKAGRMDALSHCLSRWRAPAARPDC